MHCYSQILQTIGQNLPSKFSPLPFRRLNFIHISLRNVSLIQCLSPFLCIKFLSALYELWCPICGASDLLVKTQIFTSISANEKEKKSWNIWSCKEKKNINTDILIAEEMFTKNNKNTMRFNSYILNNCLYIQVVWLELTEQRHESAMKYCVTF